MITDREKVIAIIDNDCFTVSDVAILLEGDGFNRFQKAVELYQKGMVKKILFSGNIVDRNYGSFPFEEIKPFILKEGVPESDIIHEDKSLNTREQAIEVISLAKKNNWHKLALVASHEHQYRAYMTFLRVVIDNNRDIILYNTPVRNLNWFVDNGWGLRFDRLIAEFDRIERYSQMGHLATFQEVIEYQKWKESLLDKETSINEAKEIMGSHFIGPEELKNFSLIALKLDKIDAAVPFSKEELEEKKEHYFLIYGASRFADGTLVNIENIKRILSENKSDPNFYNQDWYDREDFVKTPLEENWFLIRKDIYEDSRAISPEDLMKTHVFPSAIQCVYSFFVVWLCKNIKLWYEDFVWCSDVDHNGDRIYVGKYHDVDGINNDGFSIHRHLALRKCYTCIDYMK